MAMRNTQNAISGGTAGEQATPAQRNETQDLSAMLQSNRDLFAKMTALGGKRYTPYSGIMSAEDWVTHFGPEVWRRLSTAKREYDPNQVLSPGAGMFGRPTRSVGP